MLKNAKAKGSRNELRSKKLREAYGAQVTKAGASLGEADLIVLYPERGIVEVVQVKSNTFPGSMEMTALLLLAKRYSRNAEWYVTIDRWDDRQPVRHFCVDSRGRTPFLLEDLYGPPRFVEVS